MWLVLKAPMVVVDGILHGRNEEETRGRRFRAVWKSKARTVGVGIARKTNGLRAVIFKGIDCSIHWRGSCGQKRKGNRQASRPGYLDVFVLVVSNAHGCGRSHVMLTKCD